VRRLLFIGVWHQLAHAPRDPGGHGKVGADGLNHFEKFCSLVCLRKGHRVALDFNPTFLKPTGEDGLAFSSSDENIRFFWVKHGKTCRGIAAFFDGERGPLSTLVLSARLRLKKCEKPFSMAPSSIC